MSAGILRDPWRSRGRFVEGRLARFFRAIENHVSESLLEHREDVAGRSPAGRWDFNREILDALRRGTVPSNGLDQLAVGLARFEAELDAELDVVAAVRHSGTTGRRQVDG